jgi:hypothetical protein
MRKIYLTLIFALITLSGFSQLIRVQSSKSIEVAQSFNQYGLFSSANFGYFFSNKFKLTSGFAYSRQNFEFTQLNKLAANIDVSTTIYSFKEKIFFDLLVGIQPGIEFSSNAILGKYNQFYIGEFAGIKADYIILPYLSAGVAFKQHFVQLSKSTSAYWEGGLFVSYNF